MTSRTHAEMHRDHMAWLGENNFWRDNLRVWQVELKELLDHSQELKVLLDKHYERLAVHAAAIRAHEQILRQHEHEIVEYEKGESRPELIGLAREHQKRLPEQEHQRQAHAALHTDQYAIVSNWNALLRALRQSATHVPSAVPKIHSACDLISNWTKIGVAPKRRGQGLLVNHSL